MAEAEKRSGQQLLEEDFALARSLGVRGFPTIIMMNEENKGVKIVGGRPFEYYVDGLKKVLNTDQLQAKQPPALSQLLKEEQLLFSKEIEEMYDIGKADVKTFIENELSQDQFEMKEFLGELYVTSK